MPLRGIAPKLGLKPTTPQKAAGRITEPAVWVPTASGTCPAATAAAEPDDEPPGVRPGAAGLRVGAGCMKASSVVAVLPRISAPAAFSRATTKASSRGTRPASSAVPFSVGIRAVSMMSLTPTGTPCSAPTGRPVARCASSAFAWARTKLRVEPGPGADLGLGRLDAGDQRLGEARPPCSAPAGEPVAQLDRAEVGGRLGRPGAPHRP